MLGVNMIGNVFVPGDPLRLDALLPQDAARGLIREIHVSASPTTNTHLPSSIGVSSFADTPYP